MLVLKNAISLDYLWMQVRVHGGAYGCHIQILPDGRLGFASYRDPNIDRTMNVYQDVVDYIKSLNPDDETLLKYKIGAFSSISIVMHDSEKANTAINRYFAGSTKEDRIKLRRELVNTTKEDLKDLASMFEEALNESCMCVVGNANKIEESKINFLNKRNLVK